MRYMCVLERSVPGGLVAGEAHPGPAAEDGPQHLPRYVCRCIRYTILYIYELTVRECMVYP